MSELAIQLIRKEKEERTGKLDLGNCGLTDFPEELFELEWLDELSICSFYFDIDRQEWIESANQGAHNHMDQLLLPNSFARFQQLKKLSISGWPFEAREVFDSSILGRVNSLTSLDLSDNQISNYSFLEKLTNLTNLSLSGNKISDYSFLEKLTNLTSLSLSGNKISDIRFLEKLTNLTSLDLSENQISDYSPLEKLTNLTSLDFSGNQISDYSFLEKLTNLTSLNLRYNQISDIRFLEKLTTLTNLSLSGNQISNYNSLEKLTALTSLSLSGNKISNIRFLKKMTALTKLDLTYNHINDIRFLEKMTALTSLDLSGNQISDICFLEKLTALTSLSLSGNQISDIRFLEKMTALTSLSLSGNKISDIRFLEKMTALTSLYLSGNQISDIRFLEKMTAMTRLNLSGNKISDYSFLEKMTTLTSLDINDNQISDYSFLEKLTTLTSLSLIENQISDICFLEKMTALTCIDLSDNKINNIQELIPLIKKGSSVNIERFGGEGISLYNNPIINPPMNIVEQGAEAILNWFAQIDEMGAEPFYESKLMILGQGGAGKTTFVNLLLNPNYEVKLGKLDSTIGVVVNRGKEFAHGHREGIVVKAHLWDFGGQNIQKMLHQFFITEECLYVLVSDKRAENTNFDYWFQIINLLGPKSQVVVLENPKEAKHANEKFALNKYQELYPELKIDLIEVNFNAIQGKYKKRWETLLEMISEKLSEIELVNRVVPKRWGLVRKAVEQQEEKRYISKDDFYALCKDPSINFNKRQADWCLSYFHSLGDLVYFDDRDLCTHIFLDHNWLTLGMYYILSDKKIEESGGRFTREQAFTKWGTKEYSEEEKVMLINLLLKDKFDICYELPDEKDVFITPLLLPNDKPKSKWEYETKLRFRYQYGFIPHGLFSRLIVKLNEKIDAGQHWKSGVRLKDRIKEKDIYAEVQQYNDPEENQQIIDIKISGEKIGCKQMLASIRNAVEKLHKDFKNINVKQMVACNCDTCMDLMKTGEKPSFYEYEMLWDKVTNKSYFVECKESRWKQVNIGQIINDVIVENAAIENKDNHLLKQLKEMGLSINQITNIANGGSATSSSSSSSTSTSQATATSMVTITIQQILAETDNLKKAIEKDLKIKRVPEEEIEYAKADVEDAEEDFKEIEQAQQEKREPSLAAQTRLHGFMKNLIDEDSTFHKTLKMLRKGKDYGVKIARAYNTVAQNLALPSMPPIILDTLEKL